jgi:hypothetical protein
MILAFLSVSTPTHFTLVASGICREAESMIANRRLSYEHRLISRLAASGYSWSSRRCNGCCQPSSVAPRREPRTKCSGRIGIRAPNGRVDSRCHPFLSPSKSLVDLVACVSRGPGNPEHSGRRHRPMGGDNSTIRAGSQARADSLSRRRERRSTMSALRSAGVGLQSIQRCRWVAPIPA